MSNLKNNQVVGQLRIILGSSVRFF